MSVSTPVDRESACRDPAAPWSGRGSFLLIEGGRKVQLRRIFSWCPHLPRRLFSAKHDSGTQDSCAGSSNSTKKAGKTGWFRPRLIRHTKPDAPRWHSPREAGRVSTHLD